MRLNEYELEQNLKKYRGNVFAAALFYLKNPSDAEDVVQEVFFRLYTYSGSFESEEHLKAWLIKCAVNRSKNLLRSPWYRLSMPLDDAGEQPQPYNEGDIGEVFQMLKKITDKNRITLYLYYYEGYSTEEIAKMLGISVIAVTSRLKRGRQQLKKLITDNRSAENGT